MKSLRAESKANAASRLSRMGGKRSVYASGGVVKGYASGGSVGGQDGDMGEAGGMPAKSNFGKPGRSKGGKHGKGGKDAKKAGTNVNVIVMPHGGPPGGPPGAMPLGPGAGPPPMAPPHGPPMAGPPPGGPPPGLPMRKFGGAVKGYATGGRISNLGKYAHGGKVTK